MCQARVGVLEAQQGSDRITPFLEVHSREGKRSSAKISKIYKLLKATGQRRHQAGKGTGSARVGLGDTVMRKGGQGRPHSEGGT